jgi:hypothetical protein
MPHSYHNISDSIAPTEGLEARFASSHRFTFNGMEKDDEVKEGTLTIKVVGGESGNNIEYGYYD